MPDKYSYVHDSDPKKNKHYSAKAEASLTPSQRAKVAVSEARRRQRAKDALASARAKAASEGNYEARVSQTASDVNELMDQMPGAEKKKKKKEEN